MQLTSITLLLAPFLGSVLAAPLDARDKSMMADTAEWTIVQMQRVCNTADTRCDWSFAVDTHAAPATACAFSVANSGTTPASQSNGGPATCGPYTVTTGWSGQFGLGNGFTTLAVVDYANKEIVYPAYTDAQLYGGVVVSPDQSYAPYNL
ncbi:hypothetical protein QBC46DRAFT_398985 [Diplogelasinospora grovesii]|uniref:Small secreted protein n=1 Tax=Diplogelasinospora grovesii TaxID=303347 RepID=A0AAN6MXA7_9PEZI|nr:hypothetical protein QBC46DRAFT_398985 [Diplogelasinospora grovesii]